MDGNDYTVEFIQTLRFEDIPSEVLKQAKICLMDLVGASIAGAHAKGAKILLDFASQEMGGSREATVIRANRKLSCVTASLINGFIANALDIDDGYRKLKGHPGAAIFPTVLALSEKIGATGKEFIEALVVGYEVAIRAGEILHSHYGFYHGSGSWGAIGSAAVGAKLLDLSESEVENALGIAESYAPLVPEIRAVEHPSMAPKDGIPWGAMVGTSAAFLAQKGYTAIPSLLGDSERNGDVFTLGGDYKIMKLYFKPYPCCRWAHPAMEGVLKIMGEEKFTYKEISKINIKTFSEAASLCQKPPTSMEDAEYNLLYPVAVSAIYGEFTPTYLDEKYFHEKESHEFMEKIRITVDPKIQDKFPEQCLAEIEIVTNKGKKYHSGLISARGDSDSPLSEEELEQKFHSMTKNVFRKQETEMLMRTIKNFEDHHIEDLIKFLA